MALLQKLFQSRKGCRNSVNKWNPNDTNSKWKSPKLERNKIRLIIFGDNDLRGRQLLFDSKAIQKCDDIQTEAGRCYAAKLLLKGRGSSRGTTPGLHGEPPGPIKYKYSRPGSDIKMLEEMMFGSVAMSYQGSAMKVHFIKAPAQLMLTKVFVPEKPKRDSEGEQELFDSCGSLASSNGDITTPKHISGSDKSGSSVAQSVPMDVPSSPTYLDMIDDDSGLASASITSSGSFQTPLPSPSNNSSSYNSSSFNSLHRRWMRNQTTSLESYFRKRSSHHDLLAPAEMSPSPKKKSKLGIGIMFDLFDEKDVESNTLFQNFFFSHITLFEGHLEKLNSAIERAYYNRKSFIHIIMEALRLFREEVYDLYTAPRLSEPVWLNMMAYSNYRYVLCEQFMKELMIVVARFDNKNTNFFVSTLITAVLTHHLAWVPTVTPAGGTPSKTYLDKHSAKWLDTLAKTHPYNPLWAQLGDLHGAIGYPLRIARTVVVGKKADLVNKLLYILSYFIRCSEVHENSSSGLLSGSVEDLVFDESPSDGDRTTLGGITPVEEDDNSNNSLQFAGSICGSQCTCGTSARSILGQHTGEDEFSNIHIRHANIPIPFPGISSHNRLYPCLEELNSSLNENCHMCNSTGVNSISFNQGLTGTHEVDKIRKSDKGSCESRLVSDMNVADPPENGSNGPHLSRVKLSKDVICDMDDKRSINEIIDSVRISESTNDEPQLCRMFHVRVEESAKVEDIRHVSRAALDRELNLSNPMSDHNKSGLSKQDLESSRNNHPVLLRGKSWLSEQLSNQTKTSDHPACPVNNVSESDIRRQTARTQFLMKGSDSMFDEYFEDGSETKTIDDIQKEDIITSNPLLNRLSNSSSHKQEEESNSNSSSQENVPGRSAEKKSPEDAQILDEQQSSGLGNAPSRQTLSRQSSCTSDKHQASRPSTLPPGRCRSVTPTELGRRRHLSSTSSFDLDFLDPLVNCTEIPLIRQKSEREASSVKSVQSFERNFGRSLMAGFSDHYLSDFVLHGTSDSNFHHKLLADLNVAIQHPVLDEPVTEAVCVIADTDKWSVEVMSSHASADQPTTEKWVASQLVCNLLESVHNLWKLKMSPEFCLMHLEDRLQEIFFKSRMVMEYLRGIQLSGTKCNKKELTALLGLDSNNSSDLKLLLAIAGTTTPVHPGLGL